MDDHDHDPPSPAEYHDMDVDADMDTSDAESCLSSTSPSSTFTSSTHDLFSSTSSHSRSHCSDQTTNTFTPAPPSFSSSISTSSSSPSSSSSSSSTTSLTPPAAAPTTPMPALTEVTGRFAPLLSLFRRRRQQQQGTGGRDTTLGASGTWPPQGLFPSGGSGGNQGPQPTENAQDEVEVWLRRELQTIVRSKSARWGIDFASDPQERIASVIMAEEGLTEHAELERPPPPRDTHLDSNISDTSTASLSAQAALLQVSPQPSHNPASAATTTASSCSTTTTPSAGSNDHSSVYDVKRTGSKRPPH